MGSSLRNNEIRSLISRDRAPGGVRRQRPVCAVDRPSHGDEDHSTDSDFLEEKCPGILPESAPSARGGGAGGCEPPEPTERQITLTSENSRGLRPALDGANAEGDFREADLVRCKISIRTHSWFNWLYPMTSSSSNALIAHSVVKGKRMNPVAQDRRCVSRWPPAYLACFALQPGQQTPLFALRDRFRGRRVGGEFDRDALGRERRRAEATRPGEDGRRWPFRGRL